MSPKDMSPKGLPAHPNLLYIMTDQERYTQHFPAGWEEKNLPNMQRLKKGGVSFVNACTCTSMCSPSRTAMFTGRYPSQTGVTKTLGVGERYAPNKYNPTDIELDPRIPNLATMLHSKDTYRDVHYLGKWHMSKGFNEVDRQIGEVLDALESSGLSKSTIIVRTADHGEMGLSHGGLRQKMFNVYEETLRIPLVVSNPYLPQGKTTQHLASTIDILPTIAGILQMKAPAGIRGVDLSPIIYDPEHAPEVRTEMLFTFDDFRVEANRPSAVAAADRIRCVRTKQYKYARYFQADSSYREEYEMYDLVKDPQETNNLASPKSPDYNKADVVAKREELKKLLAQLEEKELIRG